MSNTTIVVPLSSHWVVVSRCILSLIAHIDRTVKIIFIDGGGPAAESLEGKIVDLISGRLKFTYAKSKQVLGFEAACNHSVFEIDGTDNDILILNPHVQVTAGFLEEMIAGLYTGEYHGVAFPRSNGLGPNCFSEDLSARFEVIPLGFASCFLVKRHLIDNFGLFLNGTYEEPNIFLRYSKYGYSTVRCNQAFVLQHEDGNWDKLTSSELGISDQETTVYAATLNEFCRFGENAEEHFLEILTGKNKKKSVLFSFLDFPCMYNGTTEYGLALLNNLEEAFKSKYEISVLVNQEAEKFHKFSELGFPIFYPETIGSRVFDLCFVPRQVFTMDHIFILNRLSPRIVVTLLDIISLRCVYLRTYLLQILWTNSIKYFQKVICISESAKNDILAYFNVLEHDRGKFKVVYLGADDSPTAPTISKRHRLTPYILVVGNRFKHKGLRECVDSIKNSNLIERFIILGASSKEYNYLEKDKRFEFLESGFLDTTSVESLYADADMIIFPSLYEGFGFPVLKAVQFNKKIILFANEINRELAQLISNSEHYFLYFSRFSEIPSLIGSRVSCEVPAGMTMYYPKTWKTVANEICQILEAEIDTKIDIAKLKERFVSINTQGYFYFQAQDKLAVSAVTPSLLRYFDIKCLQKMPTLRAGLKRMFYRVMDFRRYN